MVPLAVARRSFTVDRLERRPRAWLSARAARALALSSVLCSMPPEPPIMMPRTSAVTAVTQKAVLGLRATQANRRLRRGGCRSGGGKSGVDDGGGGATVLIGGVCLLVCRGRKARERERSSVASALGPAAASAR